jgi:hypothetical protein
MDVIGAKNFPWFPTRIKPKSGPFLSDFPEGASQSDHDVHLGDIETKLA